MYSAGREFRSLYVHQVASLNLFNFFFGFFLILGWAHHTRDIDAEVC